jgi:hypothetical protein
MEGELACLSLHHLDVECDWKRRAAAGEDMGCTSKTYETLRTPLGVDAVLGLSAPGSFDYVRSYDVKDDEITRLGVDCVSWRRARFAAVLVPTELR